MARWDGNELEVGPHRFTAMWHDERAWSALVARMADPAGPRDDDEPYAICKTPAMVRQLIAHIEAYRPRRILELGVYTGGSTALLAALAPDATVVAVELAEGPGPDIAAFLDRSGASDRVHVHYGVDQGDRARLRELIEQDFGGDPIDMVIDDASHELEPTRGSLDAVLPYVAPGGCYLIEDWNWAQGDLGAWSDEDRALLPRGPGLASLIAELALSVGAGSGVIRRVDLVPGCARVWRGHGVMDPATFSLSHTYRGPEQIEVR